MGFVPGYEYDIFISYAHADNSMIDPKSADAMRNWVNLLEDYIRTRARGRGQQLAIYRDAQLNHFTGVNQQLADRIAGSAIFLCVVSPNYAQSKWCLWELEQALQLNRHGRMLRISKYPVDDSELQPEQKRLLQRTDDLLEARFYTLDESAKSINDLQPELFPEHLTAFYQRLNPIVDKIISRLKELRAAHLEVEENQLEIESVARNSLQQVNQAPPTPKVFISYSHDSQEHRLRVYELLKKLRADGIHCVTDHLVMSPSEGWHAWMQRQIKDNHFILVVCTETYRRRAERKEKPGVGLGATWEAALITDEIYRNAARNERFIPVVFNKEDVDHIPAQLGQVSYYRIDLDEDYELLLRRLTNQPLFEEPPVAEKVRELPPITRQKYFNLDNEDVKVSKPSISHQHQPRVIRIANVKARSNEQISACIELDAQGDENAFAFSLAFERELLSFVSAAIGSDAKNATLSINQAQASNGCVGVAIAFPTGQCVSAGNNKNLITVIFNVLNSSLGNESNLRFADQPITREVTSTTANVLPTSWTSDVVKLMP